MSTATELTGGSFGLSRAVIDAINGVFSSYPAIQQVILYGSRAKGSQRPGSDIDLAIVAPALGEQQLPEIETRLDELSLPYTIDLSLLHTIRNPALVEHVRRVGVAFYRAAQLRPAS